MSDAHALLSEIARLQSDRAESAKEIARLKVELADVIKIEDEADRLNDDLDRANYAIRRIGMGIGSTDEWTDQETMIADVEGRVARLSAELDAARADVATAEDATRKALEAIPIAMDAAVAKEREECAKIAESFLSVIETNAPDFHDGADWACDTIAAAIRARTTEPGNG